MDSSIVIFGGSGRLGSELASLMSGVVTPSRSEVDLVNHEQLQSFLALQRPRVVVNAAAYTDVLGAESEREACWSANVTAVQNLVKALRGSQTRLIHLSTDYVFDGERGAYREDDAPGPVANYYSLTKLVSEQVALVHPRALIIRTSFRSKDWPHAVAFDDLFTSQDYVDVIAPEVVLAIRHCDEITDSILHIATERKSSFELARRRRPDVAAGSRLQAKVRLPGDVSLDIARWHQLKTQFVVALETA